MALTFSRCTRLLPSFPPREDGRASKKKAGGGDGGDAKGQEKLQKYFLNAAAKASKGPGAPKAAGAGGPANDISSDALLESILGGIGASTAEPAPFKAAPAAGAAAAEPVAAPAGGARPAAVPARPPVPGGLPRAVGRPNGASLLPAMRGPGAVRGPLPGPSRLSASTTARSAPLLPPMPAATADADMSDRHGGGDDDGGWGGGDQQQEYYQQADDYNDVYISNRNGGGGGEPFADSPGQRFGSSPAGAAGGASPMSVDPLMDLAREENFPITPASVGTAAKTAADEATPAGGAAAAAAPLAPATKPVGPRMFAEAGLPAADKDATAAAASGWQDMYSSAAPPAADNEEAAAAPAAPAAADSSSAPADASLPLDASGHLPFFFVDAYENPDAPGSVYLFGKIKAPAAAAATTGAAAAGATAYQSCCVVVKGCYYSLLVVPTSDVFADPDGELAALEAEVAADPSRKMELVRLMHVSSGGWWW